MGFLQNRINIISMFFFNKQIKVFGLPRSGTNYLEFMLSKNFYVDIPRFKLEWKHGETSNNNFRNKIFITKNPFSWIYSFYNFIQSYSFYGKKRAIMFCFKENLSFDEFIKTPFKCEFYPFANNKNFKVFHNSENIIHHYNKMNNNWFTYAKHIKYESFLENTEEQLNEIQKFFKITKRNNYFFYPKNDLKPGGSFFYKRLEYQSKNFYKKYNFYKNKEYMNFFSIENIKFINQELDKSLLKKLTY